MTAKKTTNRTVTRKPKAAPTPPAAKKTATVKKAPAKKTAAQETAPEHMASVPPASVADAYVGRSFEGTRDFDIFDAAYKNNWNVLIEGPTGPGKTTAVRAYAAQRGLRFYPVASNVGIEPSQLFGKYIPDGSGGFVWIDGPVTDLVRNGGVLLINEVNFMPERVATVLFGLLDGRREITLLDHKGETIRAHDDLLIVADMNPGYAGTRPLNEAFRNRFVIQLFWDYDPAVEQRLIKSDALRELMGDIRKAVQTGMYQTPVSTNMGMEFERIADTLGIDFAARNFVTHFQEDERESVAKLIEAHRAKLDLDLMPEDDRVAKQFTYKDGDVDPEWGVYGTDWVWDDEDDDVEAEVE